MDPSYKKRAGTSGISGQLYETKLISLILFRLLHDDSVLEFYIASNMDDIGAFDDICLKVKVAGCERPIVVLIQAKHKDKEENVLRYELIQELSASFVKIRQKFIANDNFFSGKFEDTDCLFILYTNAKYYDDSSNVELDHVASKQAWRPYQSNFSNKLNELIATGSQGCQADYTNKDLEVANEKILEEEIATLSEHFVKFLDDKTNQSMNIMLDKYILRYHVILANCVVKVSEVESDDKKCEQWRYITFKNEFFNTDDKSLTIFRIKLNEQIFKTKIKMRNDSKLSASTVDQLISLFLSEPTAITLSSLIGTHIIYKNGKLEFNADRSSSDLYKLEGINISALTVSEAETIAARNILTSLKLKVPVTFGNLDLKISGNQKKIEKRLNTLTDFICDLCTKSTLIYSYQTAVIDESVGDGFLNLNNGIGSAVGNLLVYDKVTKHLKFTENPTALPDNAKTLFCKLDTKLDNLYLYRFDVSALVTFPKMVFDFIDEAKAIFKLAVIYEKQSNHSGVETLLKKEIEQRHRINGPHNLSIKPDSMAIHYHNDIQKWWMSSKSAKYLTKSNKDNIYVRAVNNIVTEPQISVLQTTYNMNNMKYFGYSFSENALEMHSRTIVVTETFTLTTIKVIQCLNTTYAILDLECILNLANKDFTALNTELRDTDKQLIIICKITKASPTLFKRLYEITQATENKKLFIVTNNEFLETVQEYFPFVQVLSDKKHSLKDLTLETQKDIIKNTQIIFQGAKISLDMLVHESIAKTIKGSVLNKIVSNELIVIGKSLGNSSYEKIKHLYIDRRVRPISKEAAASNSHVLKTLNDIQDNALVILAEAGMGKSTLLTHLSLKTKEIDPQLWIIRINLLDYTKVFKKWQDDKTFIDILETVKFLCRVVADNNELTICLKETNNKVHLEACTTGKENDHNEWTIFVLSLFLHFYNERKLIFLFDGYDEICPHYKNIVINFFNVVKNYPREHKMWVTGRPYGEIISDLQKVIDYSYEIDYLNDAEQAIYLDSIWKDKLIPDKLNYDQLSNIKSLMDFNQLSEYMDLSLYFTFKRLFDHFYRYVHTTLIYDPDMARYDEAKLASETVDRGTSDGDNLDSNLADVESNLESTSPSIPTENQREREIMGTPLLLYLLANHIVVNIIYNKKKLKRKTHLITLYEMFIETQVDEIRFQVKNNMDTSRPDLARIFEKERSDFINMHKKLGAHALLGDLFVYFDEFKDMKPFKDLLELDLMLNTIKTGTEKTGLVSYVTTDKIPVFIHRTIGEYFATEFICDILKSNKFSFDCKKLLYLTLFYYYEGDFYLWLKNKIEIDKEVDGVIEDIKLYAIGYTYNTEISSIISDNCSEKVLIRMYSLSVEDYEDDYLDVINEEADNLLKCNLIEEELQVYKRKIIDDYVIGKMKPHVKKYFID